jgi:hypoxanthine phosphoribosyltransferase
MSRILALPRMAGDLQPVPARWGADVGGVLVNERQLRRRVAELARAITRDFAGGDLVVVALLNGTVMFIADLLRQLNLPLQLDFIGVSSYRAGQAPQDLVFTKELRIQATGRDLLLVDDILDTGRTLAAVIARMAELKPRSQRVCVLLDKPSRRQVSVIADYVGFRIPDHFVVGYGLDYAERYRNLPFIGVLREDRIKPREQTD